MGNMDRNEIDREIIKLFYVFFPLLKLLVCVFRVDFENLKDREEFIDYIDGCMSCHYLPNQSSTIVSSSVHAGLAACFVR